jgi:hypothetical protein
LAGIFSHTYNTENVRDNSNMVSDLVDKNDEAFVGNPLKAMKYKRKN